MAERFNPYMEWLGLPADLVEPNHYQLLRLPDFETDSGRIAIAADRAMSRVRGFRPGPNAKAWSKLLDELLLAKGRLLEPQRKTEYDEELRETAGADEPAAEERPFDPRFPPGMGPNSGRTATAPKEPAPVAKEPAKEPMPAAELPQPMAAPAPMAMPAPYSQPLPLTAWPTSMIHPVPHPNQPAPQAQPIYNAPPAMPAYPQPMPQYAMPQQPYAQPGYAMPQYGGQAYPAQNPASPYGGPQYQAGPFGAMPPAPEPPVNANYGGYGAYQPPQHSHAQPSYAGAYGPSAYSSYGATDQNNQVVSGMSLDPMAPVALPTSLPSGSDDNRQPRIVGFAAATQPSDLSAIPKGRAVSSAAAPASAATNQDKPLSTAPAAMTSPVLTTSSASSAMYAAPHDKNSSDKMIFYGTGAAIVLLIAAIGFAIMNAGGNNNQVAQNQGEQNPTFPSEPTPLPRVEPSKPKPSVPVKPFEPTTPRPETTKKPVVDPPEMTEPPVKPAPMPMPEPSPPKPPEVKPEPTPAIPVPMPTPPKPPEPAPDVKLTPAELTALSQALTSAKVALQERNFPETDQHLAAATKLAKSEDQKAKLNRLKMVADYVKQFDRSLKTLMADENFDAGAELVIGKSTRVVVVERDPNMIVIRINGMNKTYSLASLPDGLAMALIDKRLDANDVATKLVKASYLSMAKIPTDDNRAKATELWEEARKQDESVVADLPLVLMDTYDFKAE